MNEALRLNRRAGKLVLALLLGLTGTVALAQPSTPPSGSDGRWTFALAPIQTHQLPIGVDSKQVERAQKELLRDLSHDDRITLIDPDRTARAVGEIEGFCFERACMVELGRVVGADYVLAVQLSSQTRSDRVLHEIRIVDVAGDMVVQQTRGGNGEGSISVRTLREATALLLARQLNPRGTLVVDTVPPQSTVMINGEAIGFAPLTLERPAGLVDTVRAVRPGFVGEVKEVKLKAGQRRQILLELQRRELRQSKDFPPVSIFGIVGKPLHQASSNLDSRISWGKGASYGVRVDAGDVWRIGVGFFTYNSVLEDLDEEVVQAAEAGDSPDAYASVLHSNLFYYPSGGPVSPYLGLGVAATQRTLRHHYDGYADERSTDWEASWMLMLGLEARVYGPLSLQIELSHTRSLIEGDAWRRESDSEAKVALWERSFEDFSSFTVLRFGAGYTF